MQVELGLQQLLLQHKVQTGKARILLLQGKDRFVDHGQAQRRWCGGAARVADVDLQRGHVARQEGIPIQPDVQGQLVGGVDHHQARVADNLTGCGDVISVQRQGSVQIGRQVDGGGCLPIGDIQRPGGQRLPLAGDVQIDRAAALRGQYLNLHRLTHPIGGPLGAQEDRARLPDTGLKVKEGFAPVAQRVLGAEFYLGVGLLGGEPQFPQAVRAGLRLVLDPVDDNVQLAFRRRAVRVCRQQVEDILQSRLQVTTLGNRFDEYSLLGHRQADAHLFGVIGAIGDRHLEDIVGHAALQSAHKVLG